MFLPWVRCAQAEEAHVRDPGWDAGRFFIFLNGQRIQFVAAAYRAELPAITRKLTFWDAPRPP